MALVVKQDILGLEISVDDAESVQTFQRAEQLCRVETRAVNVESVFFLQMVEQFASVDKGENKVELLRRLEAELEGYNERVVDLRQHRAFGQCVCHLGSGDNVRLADRLERVDTVRILFTNLHHLAKTSLANHFQKLEILYLELACPCLDILDANLDFAGTILDVNPLHAAVSLAMRLLLAALLAGFRVVGEILAFLKSRVDAYNTEEDVLTTTGAGRCGGIAHIQVNDQLRHTRNIKLVLCVTASPQGAFRVAIDRVDKDLDLVKIEESVRHVLARNATVVCRDAIESTGRRVGSMRAVDVGTSPL